MDTLMAYNTPAFQSLSRKPSQRPRVYGGILYLLHPDPSERRYALVQGRHTGKWSFPKGHINEGESSLSCAIREIAEETGCDVLPPPMDSIRVGYGLYYYFPIQNIFPLQPRDTEEVSNTRWVTLEEMEFLDLNVDVNRFKRITHELMKNTTCP